MKYFVYGPILLAVGFLQWYWYPWQRCFKMYKQYINLFQFKNTTNNTLSQMRLFQEDILFVGLMALLGALPILATN